ncbi:MAG: hypothetical protein QOJ11_3307 [Frankiales bacterium]|nr:hypothetical protein [Frankiales bacterium]
MADGRQRVRLQWADRPLAPGLILLVLGLGYVVAHLVLSAHGDVTRFIVVGRDGTIDPPRWLHVFPGAGFDGQFEYRLGLAPWDFTSHRGGVRIDVPFRAQRITYPFLVWLASGFGRPRAVPYALVAVNLAALSTLGALGGRLARSYGRHAMWGLALGVYFGFVWTLSRDLTELVDAACLVAGVVGVRERRWWLAALGFSAAVLSRETSLAVVAAYGLWQLPRLRRTRRFTRADLAWGAPVAVFVLWQAYGRWRLGVWPIRSDQSNAGQPFVDLGHYIKLWLSHAFDSFSALARATEILTVFAAVVAALVLAPWRDREGYLTLSVVLLAGLGASLSGAVWMGPADLRVLGSLYVLCVVGVLRSRRPPARWVLTALVAVTAVQVLASAYHRAPIT